MSAYLKFFSFDRSPFDGEDASKVVLGTRAVRDALAAIEEGLAEGAARICVSGGSGLGKTSLARALPKLLGQKRRVAGIPQSSEDWSAIRNRIAKQWRLPPGGLARSVLLEAAKSHQLVLVLDEAEKASQDLLDHLDVLLSYHDETGKPLVQCVLFAKLGGETSAEPPPLVWWLDRIQTHQLAFEPLRPEGVGAYIEKHLARAGWSGSALFEPDAARAIHGYTGGIPGEIGRVCEQLLEAAARRECTSIDARFVHSVLDQGLVEADLCASEFEELIAEEEFDGAEPEGPSDSSEVAALLDETLARFQATASSAARSGEAATRLSSRDVPPTPDGNLVSGGSEDGFTTPELDAYLSRPPTEDELRAIRGGAWKRPLGIAAAIAIVVTGGVLAIGFGGEDAPPPGSSAQDMARLTGSAMPSQQPPPLRIPADKPAHAPGTLEQGKTPPVLARLKGPVLPDDSVGAKAGPTKRSIRAAPRNGASPPAALIPIQIPDPK